MTEAENLDYEMWYSGGNPLFDSLPGMQLTRPELSELAEAGGIPESLRPSISEVTLAVNKHGGVRWIDVEIVVSGCFRLRVNYSGAVPKVTLNSGDEADSIDIKELHDLIGPAYFIEERSKPFAEMQRLFTEMRNRRRALAEATITKAVALLNERVPSACSWSVREIRQRDAEYCTFRMAYGTSDKAVAVSINEQHAVVHSTMYEGNKLSIDSLAQDRQRGLTETLREIIKELGAK